MGEHIPTRKAEPFDFWLVVSICLLALLALCIKDLYIMAETTKFVLIMVVANGPFYIMDKIYNNK